MLRLALTPRWLGWFLLVVLASLACLWLGQWQWGRYEDRSARAERIESHYEADPVPVTEVLTDDPVAIDDEWTRVRATGTYDTGHQVLVRNRPLDGTYGYEVLLPFGSRAAAPSSSIAAGSPTARRGRTSPPRSRPHRPAR